MAAAIRSRKVLHPMVALARQACDNGIKRPADTLPARAMLADAMEDAPGAPAYALDWQADIARGLDTLRRGRRPDGRHMLRRMARAGLIRWDDIPEHRAALALHQALASLPDPLPSVRQREAGERGSGPVRDWLRAILGAACPGVRWRSYRTEILLPCRQDVRSDHDPANGAAAGEAALQSCPATIANRAAAETLRRLLEKAFGRWFGFAEADPF